jgi:hypothetical protein
MGPFGLNPTIWPPVEPADRPAKGDLALSGDKDRRVERHLRRRHHRDENPDADEFTPHQEEPESELS